MINRSSRISRSIQLNRGVRQHPDGRSGRGTAQHPAELVSRRQLGGLGRHPISADFPQQRFDERIDRRHFLVRLGGAPAATHGWQGALITAESTDFSRGSASTSYDHNLVLIEKLAGFRQLGQFTHQLRTNL